MNKPNHASAGSSLESIVKAPFTTYWDNPQATHVNGLTGLGAGAVSYNLLSQSPYWTSITDALSSWAPALYKTAAIDPSGFTLVASAALGLGALALSHYSGFGKAIASGVDYLTKGIDYSYMKGKSITHGTIKEAAGFGKKYANFVENTTSALTNLSEGIANAFSNLFRKQAYRT